VQAIPRAPLLLVHRVAGCLGLAAVSAVLPMPETHRSGQVSFLKRTGVVLKADRCRSLRQTACPFWSLPAKCCWRACWNGMRRARGVVSLYDAETSFAACDRRAKSFDGQLPDTSHLTGVHSCGKFAAVLCRAVSAYMPGQQHGSTAARQHGSTQHGSTRAFSRFYRCFRRR